MKQIICFLMFVCAIGTYKSYAQCNDYTGNINDLPVCGVYGDGSGNTNWDWEITNTQNPAFCSMWYARTSSSTSKTAMSSPFVNPTTSALDAISQAQDYTKAKGWRLLRRDFGCSQVTAYPYFVLYNVFSGLMRIYVYQPSEQPQYTEGVLLEITPTPQSPWPATTSLGDEEARAPDKFKDPATAGLYGKKVIAVGEPAGSSRWTVVEFNPAFDPYIQESAYSGKGLKFSIYGVEVSNMKARIKGKSVTSTDPKVYSYNYIPKAPSSTPHSNGPSYNFDGQGEKFLKFAKSVGDLRDKIKTKSIDVLAALSNVDTTNDKKALALVKKLAGMAKKNADNSSIFGEFLSNINNIAGGGGTILKFVGGIIGVLSGGTSTPASMPTYTSYDLVLDGTITAKNIQETFIIRIPGTVPLVGDHSNETYYSCPLGIFNIKNTPEADTILYKRMYRFRQNGEGSLNFSGRDYISYKMRNNLAVSYNDGAGLDLVSAQAAIVGEILPKPDTTATYDLFEEHFEQGDFNTYNKERQFNFMLPDLETGRLEISTYDVDKGLHTFQTPYVNIECLNGLTFNAVATTRVFLRVKAILKKKNDPENKPIVYIQDYNIQAFQGSYDPYYRNKHNTYGSYNYLPPYTNYAEVPLFRSNMVIDSKTYVSNTLDKADNTITTQNAVLVPSNAQNVVLTAGKSITLVPGFEANSGCDFTATINKFGYSITCQSPQTEAFIYPGNCFNTAITALRATASETPMADEAVKELSIYPTLSSGAVKVTGSQLQQAQITIVDQSGRVVYQYSNKSDKNSIQLNLQHLSNGIYFIQVKGQGTTVTKKLLISK